MITAVPEPVQVFGITLVGVSATTGIKLLFTVPSVVVLLLARRVALWVSRRPLPGQPLRQHAATRTGAHHQVDFIGVGISAHVIAQPVVGARPVIGQQPRRIVARPDVSVIATDDDPLPAALSTR